MSATCYILRITRLKPLHDTGYLSFTRRFRPVWG